MNKLYNIGAMFSQTSKNGMKYMTGWMFKQSKEDKDALKILIFPKKSKAGKLYFTFNIEMLENETKEQLLVRINSKIKAHLESKNFERGDNEKIEISDLPF
jgi:hypothetical protein